MLTQLTISVSHHDGCRLVHPTKWSFKNVIHHHDGCRLVHPAKWAILIMPYTIMTDVDWCILSCWSFDILIQFKMSRIDQFIFSSINHSHAINCQTFEISHFKIHFDSLCHNMTISFAIKINAHMQIFDNSS